MTITINATELARSTRDILDKVVNTGETVAIERNKVPIAQLGPPRRFMTAAQALNGMNMPKLTPAQASAWLDDSRGDDFANAVRDPWA